MQGLVTSRRHYAAGVRRSKAFKEAVGQTLAELARRGVTIAPATVEDTIEQKIRMVASHLGIQERSAWRYFDAGRLADGLAQSARDFETSSAEDGVGKAPMPPLENPELALILGSFPDNLASTGGDLYAAVLNACVNAWMAGHLHGEDGCSGCEGRRSTSGHDWDARMKALLQMQPDVLKWLDRAQWTAALQRNGYGVTRE